MVGRRAPYSEDMSYTEDLFRLDDRVAVITGGAGFLGLRHAEAIADMGGVPVLVDLSSERLASAASHLEERYGSSTMTLDADITDPERVRDAVAAIFDRYGRIDILLNNAALTGKGKSIDGLHDPFEDYPLELWEEALSVNLTGTFLVSQAVGKIMRTAGKGVLLNIGTDVALVSPDQRIYVDETGEASFNTPIAYSTTKAGLLNFTRHLATYWAPFNIRVNALCPAGVFDDHDPAFVKRLANLIPMGRMATPDEYKGSVAYLVSDASSFMTGAIVVVDGGRTAW
jgi:NAD(P)-dependent dehydrogenase (short-subunit alcohol dehydrogenase family)